MKLHNCIKCKSKWVRRTEVGYLCVMCGIWWSIDSGKVENKSLPPELSEDNKHNDENK